MGIGTHASRSLALALAVVAVLLVVDRGGVADASTEGAEPVGAELIGKPALPWTLGDWIGSPPLSLGALRGKVVLVRWFTDTGCPYCTMTAPALNQLHRDYAARGLVVVGVYHHKRSEPLDVAAVRGWARDYGFRFPVAVDRDWRTLRRWWLDGHHRDFTSVSFLIDRGGVIRYVHPGGRLALGTADFTALHSKIEELVPR